MKNYDAVVTRDGRWWMIEIPEMAGLTQARRLDDVEKVAREYIAVTLHVPMSQVGASVSGIDRHRSWFSLSQLTLHRLRRE